MIKVYESFDFMDVGRVRSLLEAHGIRTFLQNEFLSGGMGELPFQEITPRLYILDDEDLPRAQRLIEGETGSQP